jgi:hypothetical protein
MAKRYKVFVWDNVLTDYTSGVMFAVARSVEEARTALLRECNYIPKSDLNEEPQVYALSELPARVVWGGG